MSMTLRSSVGVRQLVRPALWMAIALSWSACGADNSLCSVDSLQAELDTAQPGQVVSAGVCTFDGPVRIPAGVGLRGAGTDETIFKLGPSDSPIAIDSSGLASSLSNVRVRSEACAAITITGSGSVGLASLQVDALSGLAIGAQALAELQLTEVEIQGPVDAQTDDATIPLPPYACSTGQPATHGLVLIDVEDASLNQVRVEGFAAFGALFLRSVVAWDGGGSENNVGTGVGVWGGDVDLRGLRLCGAEQRTLPVEASNGIFASGASVSTSAITVCESDVFGLFHDNVSAEHRDLVAQDNGYGGVWAQSVSSLSITGTSEFVRNGFAGVAAFDSSGVEVSGATVEATESKLSLVGQTGSVTVGDGVHVVRSAGMLENLLLTNNERVALLLDFGGDGSSNAVSLLDVTVDGSGDALGAIAQNGQIAATWDAQVTRQGTTMSNDVAFAGTLAVADIVGPVCLPSPGDLDGMGLDALVGP